MKGHLWFFFFELSIHVLCLFFLTLSSGLLGLLSKLVNFVANTFCSLFYFAYDEFVGGDALVSFYRTEMFYMYLGK